MNVFQSCSDISDAISLSSSQGLYLKPVARLNMSVQLPNLKTPGKTITNVEVMEKLRCYAAPEEFINLKVAKSTLEVVRFEGEIESRSKLPAVLARLDGRTIKLSGFHQSLKVRAAEAKPDFPNRHSWDSYFRDAKNMNEMKPGERPDTIHITNLPCKWFAAKSDTSKPSEYILRKVFDVFGEVRCVDIPMLDPFRSQMKSHISGMKMFSNNQNMIFEAYIQFKDYVCFVKAMDALRGMKLLHKENDGKTFTASIKVDFDKTKHLSDSSIRRRRVERERLMAREREREEQERRIREEEERKIAAERKRLEEEKAAKLERQRQREERRKAKMLERLNHREADDMNKKIATEERLLLIAQRRLESFRLLGELFNRLKVAKENERDTISGKSVVPKNQTLVKPSDNFQVKEQELRKKLVKKFKHVDETDEPSSKRGQHYRTDSNSEHSDNESFNDLNIDNESRGFRGRGRGGRFNRGRWRNNNMQFRGNQYPPIPLQPFPNRGGFFPQRGFPRWPRFPRNRGGADLGFFPPPFIDPYYIANDPYYKYFHKITLGDRNSCSKSRSRSRTRSYSRSYSRSSSRSLSRSRSRSKHRRSHSYSRSSHSRSQSRSSSRRRSKSRKHKSSRHKLHSSKRTKKSTEREKGVARTPEKIVSKENEESPVKQPSVHTWSRSPSRGRSLSWEKRKDVPSSSTKTEHKHKKEKKKKKEKRKRKKKDGQ